MNNLKDFSRMLWRIIKKCALFIWHWLSKTINKLILSKWIYLLFSIIFITFFGYVFKWSRIIEWKNPSYQIDENLFGTFGDFVGGVLGTILTLISVVLLIRTFEHQQKVTEEGRKQTETQRFNDLFFELLHLYQSQIAEFFSQMEVVKDGHLYTRECTNKDFFDLEKQNMQQKFHAPKVIINDFLPKSKVEAVKEYMAFYAKKPTMGTCFRTLYRIYDLVDHANISEFNKKEYLKIVRAQLTESELFFLKYNAMTYYGEAFNKYIYKYNVLKHLPLFDLLEFKVFADRFKDEYERIGMNIIFDKITEALKEILDKSTTKQFHYEQLTKYYRIRIKQIEKKVIIVKLIRDSRYLESVENIGLDHLNDSQIQKLLNCFLQELFVYNGGNKYIRGQLRFSDSIDTMGNYDMFTCEVRNTIDESLELEPSFSSTK